jgi:hypothetical protein
MAGREKQCYASVESLLHQIDQIYVYLNPGSQFSHPKATLITGTNLGDIGKFAGLLWCNDGYYFSCDDDILYPPTYASHTIQRMQQDNTPIATYHGRYFNKFPISKYYRGMTTFASCHQRQDKDMIVQFPGTGVSCYNLKYFSPEWHNYTHINMADVFVGLDAMSKNIPILALAHPKNWVTEMPTNHGIWGANSNKDKIHVEIINQATRTP